LLGDNWCPGQTFAGNATTVYNMIDKATIEFGLQSEHDYPWTGKCLHQCVRKDTNYTTLHIIELGLTMIIARYWELFKIDF